MRYDTRTAMAVAAALTIGSAWPAPVSARPAALAVQAQASDDVLENRIAFRLDTDDTLRRYDVKVEVDRGVATLSGDVATAAQKAEAERLAKVAGISRVENKIEVDAGTDKALGDRMKNGLSKTGEKITDAWITTKVNWFFVGEDLLKGSDINVDTNDRVVTLTGTVPSQAGRTRAVALAKGTEGVRNVVDRLTIGTSR